MLKNTSKSIEKCRMNQKNKLDIGFVILHYLSYKETVQCIESVVNQIDTTDYVIVIVDNYSNNGSIEKVIKEYPENEKINYIVLSNNLGYAKGNNKGIEHIRNSYECEFICCLNNDVYIVSDNLFETVSHEYEKSGFSVLGPLILSGNGKYTSNPQLIGTINSRSELSYQKKRYSFLLCLSKWNLLKPFLVLNNIKKRYSKKKSDNYCFYERMLNVQLSGACMIFSSRFFAHFDGFDERTFLYKEEDILFYKIKKTGLTSVFLPNLVVYHAEDASTNLAVKNSRNKNILTYSEYLKSLEVLSKVMDEYD